ncbi:MAG: type II toxin-antitoxin system HicB family antitoxin [Proteobacteria bacterium]|nr:type II toxin-antitoxin system HicB family antitoxin [Pseudomonadota bacterium]
MKLYAFQGLCRLQILTLRTVSILILFLGGFCRGYSGGKEPVPEPISTRPYSGKFVVRVPPEVHRMLAIQAAESGISINRLMSSKLS